MKRSVIIFAAILFFIPVVVISYRVFVLRYPFFPVAFGKIWHVSMEARVIPKEKEIAVEMGLPANYGGRRVMGERITSGTLDFNFFNEPLNRFGYWAGPVDMGDAKTISYRASVLVPSRKPREAPPALEPYPGGIDEQKRVLAERLVAGWKGLSPPERLRAVAKAATGEWGNISPRSSDLKEWAALQKEFGGRMAFLILLRAADLPARIVEGLLLDDIVTRDFHAWMEVWTGKKWESLSLEGENIYGDSTKLLPLVIGGYPPFF